MYVHQIAGSEQSLHNSFKLDVICTRKHKGIVTACRLLCVSPTAKLPKHAMVCHDVILALPRPLLLSEKCMQAASSHVLTLTIFLMQLLIHFAPGALKRIPQGRVVCPVFRADYKECGSAVESATGANHCVRRRGDCLAYHMHVKQWMLQPGP